MENADNPKYASVFPPPVGNQIKSTVSLYLSSGFIIEGIDIKISIHYLEAEHGKETTE